MIGSHNTYTYLAADRKLINTNTRFWRCQDEPISRQYELGVRYFDIRVFRTKGSFGKIVWQAAHGAAELQKSWFSVKSICNMFKNTYKNSKFRLWLEKGDENDIKAFKEEVMNNVDSCPSLDWSRIKLSCDDFYIRPDHPKWHEYSYEEWDAGTIIKNLTNFPIKEHAARVNPTITKYMIECQDEVWLMDYVCGT